MQRIARASHHAFTGRTTWSAPLIEDQPFTFRADECAHLSRNLKQSDRAMKTLIQARTSGIELLFVAPFTAGYHRNNPTPADVQRNRLIDDFSMYVQRFCDLSGHNVSILNTAVMLDAVMAHVHNRITTLQSDHRASASNAPTTNPDPAKPPPAPTPPGP